MSRWHTPSCTAPNVIVSEDLPRCQHAIPLRYSRSLSTCKLAPACLGNSPKRTSWTDGALLASLCPLLSHSSSSPCETDPVDGSVSNIKSDNNLVLGGPDKIEKADEVYLVPIYGRALGDRTSNCLKPGYSISLRPTLIGVSAHIILNLRNVLFLTMAHGLAGPSPYPS